MADFWRFFRQSKIGGKKQSSRQMMKDGFGLESISNSCGGGSGSGVAGSGTGGSGAGAIGSGIISNDEKFLPRIVVSGSSLDSNLSREQSDSSETVIQVNPNKCGHVTNEKWDDVWHTIIEPKAIQWQGMVFVNPNFARTYFLPSSRFRFEFDPFNEYGQLTLDTMAHMRNDQYEKWMKAMVQTTSCYVSMHVCQPAQLLERLCIRCPNLTRISLHYYYLDDNVLEYIRRSMPKIVSINLENSIGPSMKNFQLFGQMKNLRHLNLSGFDIYENSLKKILENCTQLESLDLSNNCAITGHCLSHDSVKRLKRLNIQDCWKITPDRLMDMVQNGLPRLQELICNSGITDKSLKMIALRCPALIHLDISFEEFTYYDRSGLDILTDEGFTSIGKLRNLRMLRLRHVGRLSDDALNEILDSCVNLVQLVLNLRHRHKLTDSRALRRLSKSCPNLRSFEAVHCHFVARHCIDELSLLSSTLQVLILRGDELLQDNDISMLIQACSNLRFINLDGCPEIGENTLAVVVVHARKLKRPEGQTPLFRASLVMTCVERSLINSLASEFPDNLRIRACDYRRNKVHYNEFDGKEVHEHSLKDKFFPFYWFDYN